jgi:PPOX class probable F420-dependent enzyme
VKPANLEKDPRVALMVIDPTNAYRWLAVDGRAALTTDGADEQIDKLAKKYTGADEYPNRVEGKQRVKVRIAPEHVTASGF